MVSVTYRAVLTHCTADYQCSQHHAIEKLVICSWISQSFFLEGHNLRLFNDQINLIYDHDVTKVTQHLHVITRLLFCSATIHIAMQETPQRADPTWSLLSPIIINFQLNHSTSSLSKHNCYHNRKAANNIFTWHLDNRKSKVKLFPTSKHTGNSGLH